MADEPSSFLARLKQHHIYRVVAGYAVGAWIVIQVTSRVFPYFGWSGAVPILIIILILGFPVVLVLAWVFIKPKDPAKSGWQQRHWKLAATASVVVVILVVVSGFYAWRFSEHHAELLASANAPIPATTNTAAPASATPIPAKSIAVLPFENLSTDKANAYFADGMQDLILTKLAVIGDLKVISRTSTEKYASHPDNLKTIAQQLGVATILEGSVQKAGNQVLINVQLIDAQSDNHLWAESYQRNLDNIFGVEGEVAQQVADALNVKLTGGEQRTLAAVPTRNPEAYDAFLKAETIAQKARDTENAADFADAEANYRRAIALDPEFALADARLAFTQLNDYWFGSHSVALIPEAKVAADRALALAPTLPDAHVALGFYWYWGFFNYDRAIAEFQRTLQLTPNNLDAWLGMGAVQRRQGKFAQALETFRNGLSLAPRDRVLLDETGDTLMKLRRYPEAKQQLQEALAIAPDYVDAKDVLVQILLFGFGDIQGARAVVTPPPDWRTGGPSGGELYGTIGVRAYPDLFARQFDAALRDFDSAPTGTQEQRIYRDTARVAIAVVAGRQASMQTECRRAKALLDAEVAKNVEREKRADPFALAQVSWLDLCVGQNAEAIAAARRAANLVPLSHDAYSGQWFLTGLAQIEAHADAPNDAIKLLEQLMAMPAGDSVSVKRLELDPVWDPLRSDPRFQALLKKYAEYQPTPVGRTAAQPPAS